MCSLGNLGPKHGLGGTWVGSPCRKFLGEEGTFCKKKMINDSPNQVAWGTTSFGKMDKIQLHTFVPTIQETPNPFLPRQLNPHLLGGSCSLQKIHFSPRNLIKVIIQSSFPWENFIFPQRNSSFDWGYHLIPFSLGMLFCESSQFEKIAHEIFFFHPIRQ